MWPRYSLVNAMNDSIGPPTPVRSWFQPVLVYQDVPSSRVCPFGSSVRTKRPFFVSL